MLVNKHMHQPEKRVTRMVRRENHRNDGFVRYGALRSSSRCSLFTGDGAHERSTSASNLRTKGRARLSSGIEF